RGPGAPLPAGRARAALLVRGGGAAARAGAVARAGAPAAGTAGGVLAGAGLAPRPGPERAGGPLPADLAVGGGEWLPAGGAGVRAVRGALVARVGRGGVRGGAA